VDLEEGFTGHNATWGWDCFDLSQFMDQEVVLCFDFGSDSSVTYPGWYIAQVRVGSDSPSPVEGETWGQIKGMFK
jgi:bacillopeptidase F (M6 metalloprotease family)